MLSGKEDWCTSAPESGLKIAVASPLDVGRLSDEFNLTPPLGEPVPEGHGGHNVTELVVALAGLVDYLYLITLDPNLEDPIELTGEKVRLSVGPFRKRARSRSKDLFFKERAFVSERLLAWKPDVVSAHWTYEYALGAIDSGLPTLTTVADWAPAVLRHARDRYRAVRLLMQLMTFYRGRDFAAVSPYIARKVQRFTRRPCAVLPNGLGTEWFPEDLPELTGNQVLAANVGYGRLKNVRRLLVAWPSVLEALPDAELILAGHGYGVGGTAHESAKRQGLSRGVCFAGPVSRPKLRELMRSSSAVAHPSLEESFGMVVLEAMALGVPVLGGQRSGAVPWLLAGDAGVLVDVRNPSAIAEGLIRLLSDKQFARLTARRGHDRAAGEFTIRRVADDYVEALSTIALRGCASG
jgi:L-malate glycosyltransferase